MHPLGDKRRPGVGENILVHQVMHGLGYEHAGAEMREPARRRELAGFGEQLEARVQRGGKNLGGGAMIGHLFHDARYRQVRIALQVARGDHFVTAMVGVVEGEMMSPVVERLAELRAAG